jgi:energy-coupling factor transport system substrate-specific component
VSWQLASTLLVGGALVTATAWYERSRPSSKLVSLVAALAALAVAGRVLFAPVPNVQATTDVVLLSGYALGAGPGFAVGAAGALASNFFLGQGPWTPWQMLGWGAVGVFGAALARMGATGRWRLAFACAFAGLAFGAWMDLFTLLTFAAERSPDAYLVVAAAGLPFNLAHAIGNLLLCLLLGPGFIRLLLRFRRRFEVRWGPEPAFADRLESGLGQGAPSPAGGPEPAFADSSAARVAGTTAAGLVLIALALPVMPERAEAAGGERAAVRYLERAQNRDGGFGAAPGQASSQLITGWAVIGLEAAGRHPLAVRRAGRSPIDFMRRNARQLSDTGELERTILALRGAGLSVRRFGGRDLVRELFRRRRAGGSFGAQVNLTAFGVLALRAAGRSRRAPVIRRAAGWITRQQNADGGFSFSRRGGASDVDDTGTVLQAFAVAGRGRARAARRALSYLRRAQNPDGGFGQFLRTRSNAQSTAWAVQGLVAARRDPARFRGRRANRSPLRYLRSLQQSDGSFRYSRTSRQTPVWVTGQAVAAVLRKTLPVRARGGRRSCAAG